MNDEKVELKVRKLMKKFIISCKEYRFLPESSDNVLTHDDIINSVTKKAKRTIEKIKELQKGKKSKVEISDIELKVRKIMKAFLIWCRDRKFISNDYLKTSKDYLSTTQLSGVIMDRARLDIIKMKKLQGLI